MLRLVRRGTESAFEFRGIKKTDAPNVIRGTLQGFSREIPAGSKEPVDVPLSAWQAFWQDGNDWDMDKPGEEIPIPGAEVQSPASFGVASTGAVSKPPTTPGGERPVPPVVPTSSSTS